MDGLRGLLAKKKAELQEEKAPSKYVKRSVLEERELKRRREEEEEDKERKRALLEERKRRHGVKESTTDDRARGGRDGNPSDASTSPAVPPEILALSHDEVTRRLRLLNEPKRLFGEADNDRYVRLVLAEKSFRVVEEDAGGQQANLHLLFERQEKEEIERKLKEAADRNETGPVADAGNADPAGTQQTSDDDELMASFKRAAEAAAELALSTEDIIDRRIKNWMEEWARELARRSPEEKATAAGKQADVRYKETKEYFRPLHSRLQKKTIDTDLLAGLKIITDAMKERNYLHAYKIYMGVAIGNSPWPIGVTHIGLHERANRERIGHKKNEQGKTHIMADEASRKYIQALKRLMTFVQRRYPTDPSRCMDFDANNSLGDGRSNKLLLLEAEAAGDPGTKLGEPVPLPETARWKNVISAELRRQEKRH
mmetsp:Transcript_13281/g.38552  ORF Transcript_13281/g.38552 Transcript_13281/m.38552 type:complete len:428 (-) Transcript_13281:1649-2932(-)